MNFKISQNKILELINIVSKAISSNSPIPALAGIKMDIKNEDITLTGSNADISIRVNENKSDEFVYEVVEEGSIIINKSYLQEIIKKIDSDIVNFELVDNNLTRISGNKAKFDINGYKSTDYPIIDFTLGNNNFEIKSDVFKKMINQTHFAASYSETRPILTGINLISDQNTLKCIATDSYRLSRTEVELNTNSNFNVTIMAKSLLDIARSFDDNESINISLTDKKAQFYNDRIMIQTRLIEGNFPDTSKFIPTNFGHTLVLDKKDLLSAISRSSFIKSENDQFAILKLSMDNNEIVMSSRSLEIGSSTENIECESYNGEPLELFFSSKYMEEALHGLEGNHIKIEFEGQMKPFVLTSLDDEKTIQLVLPVRAYN